MKSKTLVVITVVLSLLALASVANTQTKVRRRAPGTRHASSTPTASRQSGVLSIETGVVVKSGEVRPIARTQFQLLDDSLENILRDAGLTPKYGTTSLIQTLAVSHYGSRKYGITDPTLAKADEAMKLHIVATVTTDFSGKAKFSPVAAKTYYLMGVGRISEQVVIWNYKVDLKPGSSSITLDQNNAATVF